jgi:iron complex outermembrane receptor protein
MSATVGTGERGTEYMAADFGTFLNKEKSLGIRINAAHENIKPFVKNAKGKREFVSLAVDAKLSNKTLAQFDIEYQDRSQIGVSGLMLLGDATDGSNARVPTGIPADIQLNRYSWVLPTEIKSLNTGLKIDHELNDNNRVFFHLSRSEVKINDRQAYPLPLTGGTFGPTGDFVVSDFRSENELRRNDQLQLGLSSKFNSGSIEHNLKYGVSLLQRNIYQGQARFDYLSPEDNIYSLSAVINPLSSPGLIGERTKTLNHHQNSLFIQDNMKLNDKINLYLSSRFIELSDKSFSTSGASLGEFKKNYLLPSIGATYKLNSKMTNYISYSEGVESGTRPIETSFVNANPLKPRKTEQIEIGTRFTPTNDSLISATLFRASRPNEYAGEYFDSGPNQFKYSEIKQDGKVIHTGIELSYAQKVTKRLSLTSSAMYLEAKQEGASTSSMNGSQAIGIPNWRAVMFADYQLPQVEKMSVQGGWTYVSSKPVTMDNSLSVPGYHKFDAGVRYVDKVGKSKATYRLFVENLFDKFYWRDVSQTYGSNTLYPGIPRIFRATATFDF